MAVLSRSASAADLNSSLALLEEGPAVKTEDAAHRYRREAAECELDAAKATNQADREAWLGLADDPRRSHSALAA